MNISLSNFVLLTDSEKVRQFIRDVGLPSHVAPKALGLKPSEYMAWMAGSFIDITLKNIISLGQYLSIDEATIIEGSYDKNLVRSRLFEGIEILPEHYSQNQFSHVRSSAHILKYLALTKGQHYSDMILRKLSISPLLYSNLDNKISINYFMDLLDMLAQNGMSEMEIDNLAGVLFLTISKTSLGRRFQQATTYFECYGILSESSQLFDSNFTYNFDMDRKKVHIESFLSFDKHFHMNWSQTRLQRLIRYRQILMGWFPYLSKLPPILPEHKVEYSDTGVKCTYIINYDARNANSLLLIRKQPSDRPYLDL